MSLTAFCVPPCYLFPGTLRTSAVCSPFPPHRTFKCWYFLQVTGHCFINTESIPNMLKELTLGLIRPKTKVYRPKVSFYECLGYLMYSYSAIIFIVMALLLLSFIFMFLSVLMYS